VRANANVVRRAARAGVVVGVAGLVALASSLVHSLPGPPMFATISDLALVVEFGAVAFLMLAFWELGGLTPTPLARLAQAGGWIATAVWCITQVLHIAGVVELAYGTSGLGADEVQLVAQVVIGLWIAGASLLAGRWLTPGLRLLGIVTGLAVCMVFLRGLELNVDVAAFAYLVLLPVWALLMARHLAGLLGEERR
jgi:hypothetical protein